MPITGYKYSIIMPNLNKLTNAISQTIVAGLLYFCLPSKYSLSEDKVVAYVVIIDKKIINPINIPNAGEMLIATLAKGISLSAICGFDKKHITPIAINNVSTNATIMPQ